MVEESIRHKWVKKPHSLLIFSQLDYLIQIVDANVHYNLVTKSADPHKLASSEANQSGFTLFAKAGHIQVQQGMG